MADVTVETVEPHISLITLNRPDRLNALTFGLTAELHDALDAVGCRPRVQGRGAHRRGQGASAPGSTCATGARLRLRASIRTSASGSAARSSWRI